MLPLPDALLAAIRAAPTEAGPRLAAADWLDENGDAAHAALVRRCWRSKSGPPAAERAVLEEAARGDLGITYLRGFPVELLWLGSQADLVAALPRFPLLRRLRVETPVTPDFFAALETLRDLGTLTLRMERTTPLTRAEAEPLARLPRCAVPDVNTLHGTSLLTPAVRAFLTRERKARTAGRSGDDAVAAARAALGKTIQHDSDGGAWVALWGSGPSTRRRLQHALRLPELRGLVTPAGGDFPDGLEALWLNGPPGPAVRLPAGLRSLAVSWSPDPAAAEGFFDLPELRVLRLAFSGRLERLPRLPDGLRVLALVGRPLAPEAAEALALPGLVELELSDPGTSIPELLERLPTLRSLRVSDMLDGVPGGPFARYDAWRAACRDCGVLYRGPRDLSATRWADFVRVTEYEAGGLTLRVPEWFAPEPVPAADDRFPEVTPLGRWREWGEARDDRLPSGPARVELDRIGDRVPASAFARELRRGDGAFPLKCSAVTRGDDTAARITGNASVAEMPHYSERVLWATPAGTFRLRADYPARRAADFGTWLLRCALGTARPA